MSDLENTPAEPTESTPAEDQARAQGWVPKDEWQGEGKWRDAEAFLDRGELFQKIDAQRREVRELRKTQEAFNAHLKTVRDAEYKRALATLRDEKKSALIDGDADKVIKADEQILAVTQEFAEAKRATAPQTRIDPNAPAAFQAWTARNAWYSDSNRAMKLFADNVGTDLHAQGLSASEVLQEVEAQVRKEFPEKFKNPNRDKPSAVEGGKGGVGGTSKEVVNLSEMERKTMNTLVKAGVVTKEQYLADLKAVKER